ncbi:hypothetical protein PKCBPO_03132 [Methylorubrum thiocyanatum]|uniref:hypothetical protein n=1 Tax=Methylorubrum thiocyanatum TaxID=47958 RepID=UPI003653FE74
MANAEAELDGLLSRMGQGCGPLLMMHELLRAYARLPLDANDGQELVNGFAARMRAGWRLSPMPLNEGLEDASREAKRELVQHLSPQGLALVTSLDLGATLLIVKTDAGKGFLGRQKAVFNCFITEGSDGFERAGLAPTIPRAFGILDSLYQVVAAVNRDAR